MNTAEIVKKLNKLSKHDSSDWYNCPDDGEILFNLQEQLKPEREFLKSFWVNEDGCTHIPFGGLAGWKWEDALYDMPNDFQKYALERCDGKYGIFHERERWLEELQGWIFSLFHSWQFCTQGWTAY